MRSKLKVCLCLEVREIEPYQKVGSPQQCACRLSVLTSFESIDQ